MTLKHICHVRRHRTKYRIVKYMASFTDKQGIIIYQFIITIELTDFRGFSNLVINMTWIEKISLRQLAMPNPISR